MAHLAQEEGILNLREGAERSLKDRRKNPTPALSRFTLFGRRKDIRRGSEERKGGYVDRYSPKLFFFIVLILGLNVLDSIFTMMILDNKGWEVNPFVRAIIDLHGNKFWIWKFLMVSVCLVLLCLHSRFKYVRIVLIFLTAIYLMTVVYQIILLSTR